MAASWSSCSPDLSDDQIPYQPFPDIVLNLNLPDNIALKSKGISKEIDGGVRGIIVYCQDLGVYYAYERNCSYHPNEACATVNIDNSKLFMFDPCCGSTFDFATGNPTGGIAWRPLVQYKTAFNGVDLIISDEVIN
jgi:Rieske Fe-S protein